MDVFLPVGCVLISGYLAGGLAAHLVFPRITGYLIGSTGYER